MDKVAAVRRVLSEYTEIPYAYGDLTCQAVFDDEAGSYLLVTLGWDGPRRVHGVLVHIDIIDGKVWIQRDGTEEGIAYALEKDGIAKSHIVLGFQPPEVRPHTEYAAA